MFFSRPPSHYVSLCCIVKDENAYIIEWINYHRKIGVERFYIYDNDSSVPLESTLKEFIKEKIVVVHKITGSAVQCDAYNLCLKNYGKQSKWIAFIDVDEFIVPKSTCGDLRTFLKDYEKYGGVGLNWLMFGSNGHITKGKEPQYERFLYRSKESFSDNDHIKSIVQPKLTKTALNPHFFEYQKNNHCVNENFQFIEGAFSPNSTTKIQLNHYFCRSLEEFKEKIVRGRADTTNLEEQRKLADFEEFNKTANQIKDESILNIISARNST